MRGITVQRPRPAEAERLGVAETQLVVLRLGWVAQEQPVEDSDIDSHVAVVDEGHGKLVARGVDGPIRMECHGSGKLLGALSRRRSTGVDDAAGRAIPCRLMPIPDFQTLMLPVLRLLSDSADNHRIGVWSDVCSRVASRANEHGSGSAVVDRVEDD
jgi:hypothetical protein